MCEEECEWRNCMKGSKTFWMEKNQFVTHTPSPNTNASDDIWKMWNISTFINSLEFKKPEYIHISEKYKLDFFELIIGIQILYDSFVFDQWPMLLRPTVIAIIRISSDLLRCTTSFNSPQKIIINLTNVSIFVMMMAGHLVMVMIRGNIVTADGSDAFPPQGHYWQYQSNPTRCCFVCTILYPYIYVHYV